MAEIFFHRHVSYMMFSGDMSPRLIGSEQAFGGIFFGACYDFDDLGKDL